MRKMFSPMALGFLVLSVVLGRTAEAGSSFEDRVCRITDAGTGHYLGQFLMTEAGDGFTASSELVPAFQDSIDVLKEADECWKNGDALSSPKEALRISRYSGLFGFPENPSASSEITSVLLQEIKLQKGEALALVIHYKDKAIHAWDERIDPALLLQGNGCAKIQALRASASEGISASSLHSILIDKLIQVARARGILGN